MSRTAFPPVVPVRVALRVVAVLAAAMAIACAGAVPAARSAEELPDGSTLPTRPALPDPLVKMDGSRIGTPQAWRDARRPELMKLFQHYMYGYMPPPPSRTEFTVTKIDRTSLGGKATRKDITIALGTPAAPSIHLLLFVPNTSSRPVPAFLGLNFCGNHTVVADPTVPLPTAWMPSHCPGCVDARATDAGRGSAADAWCAETVIDRGYALATFYNGDVDPDRPDDTDGVQPHYYRPGQTAPGPHDWGTLAAYAWGLHRAVDYLHADPDIDTTRIAVMGHSRNGKAAILAGAFDERIDLVIPHQAGCGGTAPSRGKMGETVKQINDRFPHWFDGEFKKFNECPDRLPFDQHCLVALVAPRPILLSNAVEDTWANPPGQFEMLLAAAPVYELLGAGGLESRDPPARGVLSKGRLGYFLRDGKHSTTPQDWKAFLDFADLHFGRAPATGSPVPASRE